MTPWNHACSSASKFGGDAENYIHIHNWLDETKQYTGDWTHRALRHHSAGVEWGILEFGHYIEISIDAGTKQIPTKIIFEQHITEDCGFIPTPQDWLRILLKTPDNWMLKVKVKTTTKLSNL